MTLQEALALAGGAVALITFLVGGMDWLVRSWLQKHRDELSSRVNDLQSDLGTVAGER